MEPGREHHDAQADGRAGQGIRHDRLDMFLAGRTVVAMDRVLGNDGLDLLGNVLDDARAGAVAALQLAAAAGTAVQAVLLATVDLLRRRPA